MKKAIVVGATSGIGKELSKILAENDFKVGVTGRRLELLNDFKKLNNEKFIIKNFDITQISLVFEKMQELVDELGGLDLLILSSGTGDLNENLDFNTELNTINTNVVGFTAITDWTYNYFSNQKSGHFVAITSIAGLRGSCSAPSYGATKAFQINYLQGLQQKSAKSKNNVLVTDIRPGFVDTEMAKGEGKFWVAKPETAAKQIFSAIMRKRKTAYITRKWKLIAFLINSLPAFLYNKL